MKTRYDSIDFFKGIMCIAVVFIHASFPDGLGEVVKAISRIAVPFFFFVSGFFLSDRNMTVTREKTIKKMKHIIKLLLSAGIFYLIFHLCICWLNKQVLSLEYIKQFINSFKFIKFFITNDPLKYSHLWFLLALIYCYLTILCFTMRKGSITFNNNTCTNIIISILIIIMCVGYFFLTNCSRYLNLRSTISLFDSDYVLVLANLYIFRALPFFIFGIFIRLHENDIRKWNKRKAKYICLMGIFLGSVLSVVEYYLFGDALFYIGTCITLFSASLLTVNNPEYGLHFKSLIFTGRELSMYIYVYHIAVMELVGWFFNSKLHIYASSNLLYAYIRPFIVLLITFLVACIFYFVKKRKILSRINNC